jgi:hypothetical protein
MSRPLEARIPPDVRALLDADLASSVGVALLLLAISEEGWPHQAMISCGEIAAVSDERLAVALWPSSTAARVLAHGGRATLTLVLPPTAYALRLDVEPAGELETPMAGRLARFLATVAAATADEAPYATLESGVRYSLKDPDQVLARWREVREALRA